MKLFEWTDGPLLATMLAGEHLLVDEISLADDSVLERLNSVLEPERCLVIPDQMSMVRSAVDVLRRTKTLILSVATLGHSGS